MKRIFGLALVMLAAAGLGAHDFDFFGSNGSPTQAATGGHFQQEFDVFLDVNHYSELDSNVLFLSFGMPSENDNHVQAGTGYWMSEQLYLATMVQSSFVVETGEITDGVDDTVTSTAADGSTETIRRDSSHEVSNVGSTTWDAMGGITVAGFDIGIKNQFNHDVNETTASYAVNFNELATVSTSSFDNINLNLNTTTNYPIGAPEIDDTPVREDWVKTVTNADGDLISTDVTDYDAQGGSSQLSWSDELELGTNINLGPALLLATLNVGFGSYAETRKAGLVDYNTIYNPELPNYRGIANAEQYDVQSVEYIQEASGLNLGLDLDAEYPLNPQWTITAGVGYGIALPMGNTRSINASHFNYNPTYTALADTLNITQEQTSFTWNEETTGMNQSITVPVELEYQSDLGFSVALGYSAVLDLGSQTVSSNASRSQTKTVTNNVGDVDETETITRINETYRNGEITTETLVLTHAFSTGARIPLGERLSLNLGSSGSVEVVNRSTATRKDSGVRQVEKTEEDDGVLDPSQTTYEWESSTVNHGQSETLSMAGSDLRVNYSLGISYQVNDQITLDLQKTDTNNIFELAGWSLLMTMKY